jgi:hypothetical protein
MNSSVFLHIFAHWRLVTHSNVHTSRILFVGEVHAALDQGLFVGHGEGLSVSRSGEVRLMVAQQIHFFMRALIFKNIIILQKMSCFHTVHGNVSHIVLNNV